LIILKLLYLTAILLTWLPSPALGKIITKAEDLATRGVKFTWPEVRSKSLKIVLEYQEQNGAWRRANLGSGFLISPDGLFVTAYHVMKYCLVGQEHNRGLSVKIDCSAAHRPMRYKAVNGEREFDIQIVSFLKEADSTRGKSVHTPDEIIKQRDFVIGKIASDNATLFTHWTLREFDDSDIDLNNPRADFQLAPLMPPKRVFIVGFSNDQDFVISEGFLNLTDQQRRGYFAADYKVYSPRYLQTQGVALDTEWGIRVENHMSGGAVIDASGDVVGLVVNGNRNTAGILSIENVLSTFFSPTGPTDLVPSIVLNPTAKPLYLKNDISN
jgi:Trypsin-like peptidase domain